MSLQAATAIELMIDGVVTCVHCGKTRLECRCYVYCPGCNNYRLKGSEVCPNHTDGSLQTICVCELPENVSRRSCADARGNKTPCRCYCHRVAKLKENAL